MANLLCINDVMKMVKVSRSTVYTWINAGLPYLKIGRSIRFNEADLVSWLEQYKTKGR